MGNRDLLLILNIVDYLLETTESAETKDDLRNVVIQGLGVDTINPETASSATENVSLEDIESEEQAPVTAIVEEESEELKALKEEIKALTHKNEALQEQIESQQQITQMTVENLLENVNEIAQENKEFQEYEVAYKKQSNILFEQVSAQLEMMQMTIEYLTEELKELTTRHEALVTEERLYKRQGRIMMEQVDAQLNMMQMTIEFLTEKEKNLEEVSTTLKVLNDKAKKKELRLIEQISSQLDMFQMTSKYQLGINKDLESTLKKALSSQTEASDTYQLLIQSVIGSYFNAEERLKVLFSEVVKYPIAKNYANNSFICLIEKFGIIYIAIIRVKLDESIMGLFNLVSNFAFNNIIGIKKYVDPSRIIEEYLKFISAIPQNTQDIDKDKISVSVCLVDNINLEVEYASTGPSAYSAFNAQVEEHLGGANKNSGNTERKMARDSQYRIRKIGFRKGGMLFMNSLEAERTLAGEKEGQEKAALVNLLKKVNGTSISESTQLFEDFAKGYASDDEEAYSDNDFLILGIKF